MNGNLFGVKCCVVQGHENHNSNLLRTYDKEIQDSYYQNYAECVHMKLSEGKYECNYNYPI